MAILIDEQVMEAIGFVLASLGILIVLVYLWLAVNRLLQRRRSRRKVECFMITMKCTVCEKAEEFADIELALDAGWLRMEGAMAKSRGSFDMCEECFTQKNFLEALASSIFESWKVIDGKSKEDADG